MFYLLFCFPFLPLSSQSFSLRERDFHWQWILFCFCWPGIFFLNLRFDLVSYTFLFSFSSTVLAVILLKRKGLPLVVNIYFASADPDFFYNRMFGLI
jgi:hypothetical protein